jgi:hypothetical protein
MTALHQIVQEKATPNSSDGAVQLAPMSEKLLRIERLIAVLDARSIQKVKRAQYLQQMCGSSVPFWSGVLGGSRSFGEKLARRLEHSLGLLPKTLEEHGVAPDASEIAAAFDALPVQTLQQIEMRKGAYVAIMGMIGAMNQGGANTHEPPPAGPPTGARQPRT